MILGFEHTVQISVFLKAIAAGYLLGFLWTFVMFFNAVNGRKIFVFFRDVLFFVFSAFFTFLFALKFNAGIIRFYILAGETMGFIVFYLYPGVYLGNFFRKNFEKIKKNINNFIKKHRIKLSKHNTDKLNKHGKENTDINKHTKLKKRRKKRTELKKNFEKS